MIQRRRDLAGIDDFVAELALARRNTTPSGRRHIMRAAIHSLAPTDAVDARGYLVTDAGCLRPAGHDRGCLCEHDIERVIYRVDDGGRERDAAARGNTMNREAARARWRP